MPIRKIGLRMLQNPVKKPSLPANVGFVSCRGDSLLQQIKKLVAKFQTLFSPPCVTPNGVLISQFFLTADIPGQAVKTRELDIDTILQHLNLQGMEELAGWIQDKGLFVIRQHAPEIIGYLKDWIDAPQRAIYATSPNHMMQTTTGRAYSFVKDRLREAGFERIF